MCEVVEEDDAFSIAAICCASLMFCWQCVWQMNPDPGKNEKEAEASIRPFIVEAIASREAMCL